MHRHREALGSGQSSVSCDVMQNLTVCMHSYRIQPRALKKFRRGQLWHGHSCFGRRDTPAREVSRGEILAVGPVHTLKTPYIQYSTPSAMEGLSIYWWASPVGVSIANKY